MKRILTALVAASFAVSAFTAGAAAKGAPGLTGLDPSVRPGDNFFAYANGTWLQQATIPSDRSSYGSFAALIELTTQRLSDLIQHLDGAGGSATPEALQVRDYYDSFLDQATLEKKGLSPLQPRLQRLAQIADRHQLATALGETLRADIDILNDTHLHTPNLFGLWVAADLSNPTRYVPFLYQGGLALPDRDYYLNPSASMAHIRDEYRAHIARVLRLAAYPNPQVAAARIFALEHQIAEAHLSRTDSEDPLRGNNHWTRGDLDTRAPGLDWSAYLKAARLDHMPGFIVWQPGALTKLSALTASQPLEAWKAYLTFHALEQASPYLPKAFSDEAFAFYGTVLSGTPQQPPRWKQAVDRTNQALGEAVGKLYVERYFPASERARAQAMVRNILTAFSARIDRLEWMAPETKTRAKAKLATLNIGVGYPDHWRDYSALKVIRGDAFGNAERARQFADDWALGKLGRPVDRAEWAMTPQTVNAVNLPVLNAINFPAALLQPPFFDPRRPAVMDYGAMGAVIGHEISHSFDNAGALFDAHGRHNWWQKADFAHFQAAGIRLADQYDAYRPFPDLAVNGHQTLAENIADVAGLSAAYDAYHLSLHGASPPSLSGFSGDQLFFLSYAQSKRIKIREPALRQAIAADGHAPGEYRADTVRNLDPWYAAFAIKPGEALYLSPADRVHLW